ncbi:MAG: low molecular weight phosphatase family protein [Acidobacteriia bacterium]|nr:low molecular weight phosphatase family protein [Terriglobia bacterium]
MVERRVLPRMFFWARRGLTPDSLRGARLVFVCQGNVCRSPFAEGYARRRLREVEVHAVGLSEIDGRVPPAEARAAAAGFDVDLSGHRSRSLGSAVITAKDLFLVMDGSNLQGLERQRPGSLHRAFLLDPHVAIEDPFGKSPIVFQAVYSQIARAIDRLATLADLEAPRDER